MSRLRVLVCSTSLWIFCAAECIASLLTNWYAFIYVSDTGVAGGGGSSVSRVLSQGNKVNSVMGGLEPNIGHGAWLRTLCIIGSAKGHSSSFNLNSDRSDLVARRDSLHTTSTVTSYCGQWGVLKWSCVLRHQSSSVIRLFLKCGPWSETQVRRTPKEGNQCNRDFAAVLASISEVLVEFHKIW